MQKRLWKQLFFNQSWGSNFALLPMIATLIVNIFVEFLLFFDFCFVLSALSDQIEQEMRRQQEIAGSHWKSHRSTGVMVLQMRPHFIYNPMAGIYWLYTEDPEKAQQVILDFTTYMHKNFTAVASTCP